MKDSIDELKELEKQSVDYVEVEKHKSAARTNHLRTGLGLIVIGVVLLAIILSGANVWQFWWLIFFVKPLLFGWGWGWSDRGDQAGWSACGAKKQQTG